MFRISSVLLGSLFFAVEATASQTWSFDVETTGSDVFWTSPSGVDPTATVFSGEYEILSLTIDVTWNGLNFFGIDALGLVPLDLVSGSGLVDGPAPIELLNDSLIFPEPPDPPAVSADLVIGADASGFAFLNATNVVLGTLSIDLGIFGVQTVTLTKVEIAGEITVHGTWFQLGGEAAGTYGAPVLTGNGALIGMQPMGLELSNALENSLAGLIIGLSRIDAPFKGGTWIPAIDFVFFLPTDSQGAISLASNWANGVPSDTPVYFQYWIFDGAAVGGLSASNAVVGISP